MPNALASLLGYVPQQNALAQALQQPQQVPFLGLLGAPPVSAQASNNLLNFGQQVMNRPLAPANSLLQPTLGSLQGMALDAAPGIGDYFAMQDFNKANQEGDRWGAALSGASLIPGVGDLAVAAKGLLGAKAAMSGVGLLGQTVFHGTPHDFDAFKLDKIGTGEGAQAYGHGLYFAENPEVAKSYSGVTPAGPMPAPRRFFQGQELAPGSPEYHAATLVDGKRSLPAVRKELTKWIQDADSWPAARKSDPSEAKMLDGWKATLETLNKAQKPSDFARKDAGRLYTVDIPDSAIEKMLDWDKPLSEQPEAVRKAVLKLNPAIRLSDKGNMIYRKLSVGIYDEGLPLWEAEKKISESLREIGIPGIKYLDQGSRDAGKGTRNFVVFDETLPKIVKKE